MTGRTTSPPRSILRRLAEVRAENHGVLSVYVDLDPSVFPTPPDRQTEIASLTAEAEQVFTAGILEHDEQKARKAAVDRLREVLNDPGLAREGTRGVAVFAAPTKDVFEVVELDGPVPPSVVVDDSPYVRPLADEAGPRTWAVLLVDQKNTRLLYGGLHRLVEIESFSDFLPGGKSKGGWSQSHYERHMEDVAHEHFKKAAEALKQFFERSLFDSLAIAAPDPLYETIVDKLDSRLRERLRGRVRIEIDHPTPHQVLDHARPVFEEAREAELNAILQSLDEGRRDRVATGPVDTLRALSEQRVDTLVLEEQLQLGGVRCSQCTWIGVEGDTCPFDNAPTEKRDDIVDDAVDVALLQSARVVTVGTDAERRPPQPIAALLRF